MYVVIYLQPINQIFCHWFPSNVTTNSLYFGCFKGCMFWFYISCYSTEIKKATLLCFCSTANVDDSLTNVTLNNCDIYLNKFLSVVIILFMECVLMLFVVFLPSMYLFIILVECCSQLS